MNFYDCTDLITEIQEYECLQFLLREGDSDARSFLVETYRDISSWINQHRPPQPTGADVGGILFPVSIHCLAMSSKLIDIKTMSSGGVVVSLENGVVLIRGQNGSFRIPITTSHTDPIIFDTLFFRDKETIDSFLGFLTLKFGGEYTIRESEMQYRKPPFN